VAEGHHVAGQYLSIAVGALAQELPADEVAGVLDRAGETRSLDELLRFPGWSTYDQFRRLLEEASRARRSSSRRRVLGPGASTDVGRSSEILETIQAMGSPGALLASFPAAGPLLPITRSEVSQVTPTEWTIRRQFIDGFAPYPEFCQFFAEQFASIPVAFGIPPAEVTHEECQCRGDDACLFRVRWEEADEAAARTRYFEARTEVLEARLEQLQGMIYDLASNEHYEEVLGGIVVSSARAVGASAGLLVLKPRAEHPRQVYAEGTSDAEADLLADDLLGTGVVPDGWALAQVTSARAHYGVLAVDEGAAVFPAQSQATLETYARLAAAALDSVDALEDARRQANTAQVLLELSMSLGEIVSTEDMAAKVARAAPVLIDCDRAAVFLDGSATGDDTRPDGTTQDGFYLAGAHGFPDEVVATLGSAPFQREPRAAKVGDILQSHDTATGSLCALGAPIVSGGVVIGWIVVSVTSQAERLDLTPQLSARLGGLAAQAASAIGNARLVDQIRHQAVHDGLTGLPNRALILDRTQQMLSRSRRTGLPVAALFIDLDGFKDVNDTMGHGVGDDLLRAVTARLVTTMRESDSVGRLGGDEFVVLVDGTTMDVGPELVAERLLEVLREPFDLEGVPSGHLTLTASIGIAAGIRASATELLRDADIALYAAKAAGKDCFCVFHPEMHIAVQDSHLLEMDLREAMVAGQFFLLYQPIFNLRSGQTTGVESLLRWEHPTRGVVQPDSFIPVLEKSGMICEVGRWVLTEACHQGARWHREGNHLEVSVNMSARQLESDRIIGDVQDALDTSGFPAASLIIEITETAIMRNVTDVIPRLTQLKAIGVRIAIDDFGTGYSSLAYLQQFPVDTIKIDRSFISAMADSPESGALIHTLVQLGKTLGLETLAEGIEENDQYSQLDREHCDSGQGYLFARPMESEAVTKFLGGQPLLPTT
jgi:diguanylate cyclase (GGDEF)-like protein